MVFVLETVLSPREEGQQEEVLVVGDDPVGGEFPEERRIRSGQLVRQGFVREVRNEEQTSGSQNSKRSSSSSHSLHNPT